MQRSGAHARVDAHRADPRTRRETRASPRPRRAPPCMSILGRSMHSDFNILLSPPHCAPSITNHLRCQLFPLRTHTTVNTTAESVEEQTEEHPGLRDAARCASGPRRYSTAAERPAVPSASLRIPEITHRNPRSWDAASGSRLRCTSLSTALLRAPGPRLSLSRPPHGAMRGPHPQSISHLHRHTASSSF